MLHDGHPRVLLVEDSPSNALVYRSYLEEDYEVDVAHTGRDALDYLGRRQYQALVTDVRLPDMTGLDILDHVQSDIPDLPVVVITAHGSVDMVVDDDRFFTADAERVPDCRKLGEKPGLRVHYWREWHR